MNQQKRAFNYALTAIALLAAAMVLYYYFQNRSRKAENEVDLTEQVEEPVSEQAEFIGIYNPEGPLQAGDRRLAYFTVNRKEDGGYLGSATIETVGAEGTAYLECVDVRIEERDFFLRCARAGEDEISVNGQWQGSPAEVSAKVIWVRDGQPLLETSHRFQLQAVR